jgi:hypothetical protein
LDIVLQKDKKRLEPQKKQKKREFIPKRLEEKTNDRRMGKKQNLQFQLFFGKKLRPSRCLWSGGLKLLPKPNLQLMK